jgi:hypothetical protein
MVSSKKPGRSRVETGRKRRDVPPAEDGRIAFIHTGVRGEGLLCMDGTGTSRPANQGFTASGPVNEWNKPFIPLPRLCIKNAALIQ